MYLFIVTVYRLEMSNMYCVLMNSRVVVIAVVIVVVIVVLLVRMRSINTVITGI